MPEKIVSLGKHFTKLFFKNFKYNSKDHRALVRYSWYKFFTNVKLKIVKQIELFFLRLFGIEIFRVLVKVAGV